MGLIRLIKRHCITYLVNDDRIEGIAIKRKRSTILKSENKSDNVLITDYDTSPNSNE